MIKKLLITEILYIVLAIPCISQGEQLVINLSSSLNNRVFTFENPKGSVKITGYDGEDIVVNAVLRSPESQKPGVSDMKRIEKNPLDIYAETDGNNVALYSRVSGKTVDFDIKIPKNFSMKLKSLDNGDILVINIDGEIEVENTNGNITLENISGSSVLSTVYGNISAAFRAVKPDSPMAFTSFEGEILLYFPVSVNATVKMKTGTGEIRSDFDIIPVKRQPVVKKVENTRIYSLEDWVVGRVNEGGPEYVIRSYSGNIIIKKRGY